MSRSFCLRSFALLTVFCCTFSVSAQISINPTGTAPDSSAMLDVSSTDKGLLLPRLTTAERDAIANPATGLMVYNTDDDCFNYFAGDAWVKDCGRALDADTEAIGPVVAGNQGSDNIHGLAVGPLDNVHLLLSYQGDSLNFLDTTFYSENDITLILVKMSRDRQIQWSREFDTPDLFMRDIAVDAIGNVFVIGSGGAGSEIEGDSFSELTSFILKYDADGEFAWITTGSSTDTQGVTMGTLAVGIDGYPVVAGDFRSEMNWGSLTETNAAILSTGFVMRLDPEGIPLWIETIKSATYSYPYGVTVGPDGSIYAGLDIEGNTVVGTETILVADGSIDGLIVKFNADGSYAWAEQLAGSGYTNVNGVYADAAGAVYLTGEYDTPVSLGATELSVIPGGISTFVAKLDGTDGTVSWADQLRSSEGSFGWRLAEVPGGNIVLSGGYRNDFSADDLAINTPGNQRTFTTSYTPDGERQWFWHSEGDELNSASRLAISSVGTIYLAGVFRGTAILNDQDYTSMGRNDIILYELTAAGTSTRVLNSLFESQDGDTDPTNELQSLSLSGSLLTLSNGGTVDLGNLSNAALTDNRSPVVSDLVTENESLRTEVARLRRLVDRMTALEARLDAVETQGIHRNDDSGERE